MIRRRPHARGLLTGGLVAAGVLAAGCGGSSSPFSGSFHAPTGYTAYHGSGYVVAIPARFVAKPGSVADQPPGSTVTEVTRGGSPAAKAQSEILLLENPHLKFTLDQVVDNLEQADRTNTSVTDVKVTATKATVPGAHGARIVTESYVAPDSPSNPTRTHFDRKWLMVLIRPGVLLDVVVANAPALGGHIDADAVIDSFRLRH
ncbi:MAG TPA: hypothetical protein VJ741_16295 [Solirubrobacteraceae bacterium]|nr:hypothetical protein [Solirubrobacteraceae bacterium]